MKQAKWIQVRCRDGRVNRVPVQKIVRLLEKKGVFIPDLYDHAHIKHVSKLLEWREVCDFNQAWTDPIPVNYADEWKDRDFEIIEDETSDEKVFIEPVTEETPVKPEVKDVETKREPSKPRKRTSKRVQ